MLPRHIDQHIERTDSCWVWHGRTSSRPYGLIGNTTAHRVVYELLVGAIPEGYQLDHLCRNPKCVNPDHLEPVTPSENQRRNYSYITHCPQGHEYTPENTAYWQGGQKRQCRECYRIRNRRYHQFHRRHRSAH